MKHLDLTTLDHEAEAALHGVPGLTEVWPATQTTQPPEGPGHGYGHGHGHSM